MVCRAAGGEDVIVSNKPEAEARYVLVSNPLVLIQHVTAFVFQSTPAHQNTICPQYWVLFSTSGLAVQRISPASVMLCGTAMAPACVSTKMHQNRLCCTYTAVAIHPVIQRSTLPQKTPVHQSVTLSSVAW